MNRRSVYALAALAPFLVAATVNQGHMYGRYHDRVYTAPGKLFRVSAPFPDDPAVSDGQERENNNAGAVSFIDTMGRLNGILYMEARQVKAPGEADPQATKVLASWFRDTGFPGFFRVGIPNAKVLREEAGTIAGRPAWIAVAHLPKASPLGHHARNSNVIRRNDSWRGMAVVAYGRHFYLLQTELRIEKLATPDWRYDFEAADWNRFVPELEALFRRIEFLKP